MRGIHREWMKRAIQALHLNQTPQLKSQIDEVMDKMNSSQMARAPSRSQYGPTKRLCEELEKAVGESVKHNTIIMPIGPDMLHLE